MSERAASKSLTALYSSERARGLLAFRSIGPIALCADVIIIVGTSVLSGMIYHLIVFSNFGAIETFLGVGALAAVNFSAIMAAFGSYRPEMLSTSASQIRDASKVWLFAFFLLSTVAFSLKISGTYSRGATLTFFAVAWFVIVGWRLLVAQYIERSLAAGSFAEQKTILLADNGQLDGRNVAAELKRYGYNPVRTFSVANNKKSLSERTSHFDGLAQQILELSRSHKISCILLLISWEDRSAVEDLLSSLGVVSLPIYLLPDRNVAHFLDKRIVSIGATWTAELKRAPLTSAEQAVKRAIDVLIASVAIALLAPSMVLLALMIKLESSGPVLFVQTRNGFNGRPFRIYKFRTMSVLEDGPVIRQVTKNDPRVTTLGRLLRRANIDELPQLFNVLAGDMSLVGPRPHAAAHNSEYQEIIANYAYRYHVKPGLTGWAQVHGLRGETLKVELMERRVQYDLWYINNWSLWLDFKILLRTGVLGLQSTAY